MLDHLSTQAQQALDQAEAVAHRLAHDYIGTEHLLAGLAYTEEPEARRVLARCGLDGARVEAHLEVMLGRGRHALSVRPPLTASANLALARSRWEARAFGRAEVASTHLLLALVRQADSAATTVLAELGADLDQLEALLLAGAALEAAPGGEPFPDDDDVAGGDVVGDTAPQRSGPAPTPVDGPDEVAGDVALPGPATLDRDEPLAIQVVRLTHQLARLERQVAELTARLDGERPPSPPQPPSSPASAPPPGEQP